MSQSDADASTPLERLEAVLPGWKGSLHELLPAQLAALQQAVVGDSDPARVDRAFQDLLNMAWLRDAGVLGRLLDEPRVAVLAEPTRQVLEALRLLRANRLPEALATLPAMAAPGATRLQLLLASRLAQHLGQQTVALALLRRLADLGGVHWTLGAEGTLERHILRQIERRQAPRRTLTLCAALLNEAPHLEEWVAYHALVGVEAFCLYDNRSSDDTRAVLERLSHRYPIEIVDWPRQPANLSAFQNFLETRGQETEWLACIDADEYLVPAPGEDLRALLAGLPSRVAAITPNWRTFGSSGQVQRPAGLTLETYRGRAADGFAVNRHVKSLVRPARAFHALTTHQFLALGEQLDGDLRPALPLAGQLEPPRYGRLWVNHYVVRSQEDFAAKRTRGRPEHEVAGRRAIAEGFFAFHDRNEVADHTMERFLPALRAALGRQ